MTFAIYDLPVGAGWLGIAPIPKGHEDIDLILGWGATMVISMTTNQEMGVAGVPGLGRSLMHRAITWSHVPVADFGVPDSIPVDVQSGDPFLIGAKTSQNLWDCVAPPALAVLNEGGRVLVHCKGGCGRSGMAALRLMILAGENPGAALVRLRQVRPCAVETDAQLAWAGRPLE